MRTLTWAALMSAVVVATGCGGGLPRKQLSRKADAICGRYSKQGAALGSPDFSDLAKAKVFFDKATGLARRQQGELTALKPDGDTKADYGKLTDATGRATKLLADLAAAATANDRPKFTTLLGQLDPANTAVNTTAKTIGADTCAG